MNRRHTYQTCLVWSTRFTLVIGLVVLVLLSGTPAHSADTKLTDDAVRKLLIEDSIASYPGNCPCPYNVARNGSRCGKRSAWSRAGGYAPLCYPNDVTNAMIKKYREQNEDKSAVLP